MSVRNWINEGVEVEGGEVRVFSFDVDDVRGVVSGDVDDLGKVVVQIGESDPVLCTDRLPDNDLVDVVELIPIVINSEGIFDERLEFGASWNGHVESFGREEGFEVEQIEVVVVDEVGEELVGYPVEAGELGEGEVPLPVRDAVDVLGVDQRVVVVEPFLDGRVLLVVQLDLNGLEWLHVQHVVRVVQRRLLIVKWREPEFYVT